MRHIPLGPLTVSALGLGCMGFSQAYGPQDEEESIRALHRALDLGISFFDTAEVYGPHRNEALLGRALKGRDAVIATKFGFTYRQDRDDFGEITGTDGSPANARRVAEAALRRLGREVIDLYYLHHADPDVPIKETVGAMAELVAEGNIRAIGLSEVSAAPMRCNRSWCCKASIRSGHALRMLSPAFSASATFVPGLCRARPIRRHRHRKLRAGLPQGGLVPFMGITLPKWAFFSNSPRAKTKERRTVTRQSLSIFGYPPGSP